MPYSKHFLQSPGGAGNESKRPPALRNWQPNAKSSEGEGSELTRIWPGTEEERRRWSRAIPTRGWRRRRAQRSGAQALGLRKPVCSVPQLIHPPDSTWLQGSLGTASGLSPKSISKPRRDRRERGLPAAGSPVPECPAPRPNTTPSQSPSRRCPVLARV